MKTTFEAYNGKTWKTYKTYKTACNMLSKRFNNYIENNNINAAYEMDNEQIFISTEEYTYCYARIEVKVQFKIEKYK